MQDLAERVTEVRSRIADAVRRGGHGQAVRLVAVTKTHGPEAGAAVQACGIEDVGENRVQEALDKQATAAVAVRWHLIGHLQRNKVKALDHFWLLHALDSSRLARKQQMRRHDRAMLFRQRRQALPYVRKQLERIVARFDFGFREEAQKIRRISWSNVGRICLANIFAQILDDTDQFCTKIQFGGTETLNNQ